MSFSLENLQKNVQSEFNKIREAINVREQLLLRQLDVICNSNQSYLNKNNIVTTPCSTHDLDKRNENNNDEKNNIDEIKFISDKEVILGLIRNYGKFNLENVNVNFTNLLYINEDEPEHDTPTMVKCLENVTKMTNVSFTTASTTNRTDNCEEVEFRDENIEVITYSNENNFSDKEKIIIDFSNNRKFITENVSNLNESVINITLNEAKELIEKSSNAFDTLEIENEKETIFTNEQSKNLSPVSQSRSLLPSNSSTTNVKSTSKSATETKKQRKSLKLKPKITINNCNGVINLKNISSLTINCANKDSMNVNENRSQSEQIDVADSIAESQQIYSVTENGDNTETDEVTSVVSENNTTINESSTTTTKDDENYVNCEFYNRLIAEIKNTLKQQQHQHAKAHAFSHINTTYDNDDNCNEINNENQNDNANNNYIDSIHVEELKLSAGESSTTLSTPNTNNISSNTKNSTKNKKLLLKNLENLKIILEKSEDDSLNGNNRQQGRPVQIEQWLAEIISETEIEPMLNSEILELSKIQSETITSTCGKSTTSS